MLPRTFVSIHSSANLSDKSTNLEAAQCMAISGFILLNASISDSIEFIFRG